MDPATVAWRAGMASFLEPSAEKPGNVTPTKSFNDLTYHDFIMASSFIQRPMLMAAEAGAKLKSGDDFSKIRIGKHILNVVNSMQSYLRGVNPNFGIILMFTPLAVSAGHMKKNTDLRTILHKILSGATAQDTVDIYRAMRRMNIGGLVNPKNIAPEDRSLVRKFNINRNDVFDIILKEDISPMYIFKFSSHHDTLAGEWISNYGLSFTYLDVFKKNIKMFGLSEAIVYTYLQLLSNHPDTFIARKRGNKVAQDVSDRAYKVLKNYPNGLKAFDKYLRDKDNAFNPGTSADLIATILYIWLLQK